MHRLCVLVLLAGGSSAQSVLEFEGESHDQLGRAVEPAADFDQDGVPDLLFSAPQPGALPSHGNHVDGFVEIRSGADGALLFRVTGFDYEAATGADAVQFGLAAAMAGDLDGDGASDVLVNFGPPFGTKRVAAFAAGVGQVPRFLFEVSEPITSMLNTATNFGRVIECVGDVVDAAGNAVRDGVPDFVLGSSRSLAGSVFSPGYNGHAFLYSGANANAGPVLTYTGSAPRDYYGADVAALGDLDGDGFPEFAIGALGQGSGRGYVDVVDGRTQLVFWQLLAPSANEQFGGALSNVGDVNGDGRNDLAVGLPGADVHATDDGRVDVYSLDALGGAAVVTSLALDSGHPNGAGLGARIAGLPFDSASGAGLLDLDHDGSPDPFLDLDLDGAPDYLVSAPGYELPGADPLTDAGAWFVFRGDPAAPAVARHGEPLHQGPAPVYSPFASATPEAGELFARGLALLGNAVGESRALLAIGTPGDASDSGSVFVWRSSSLRFDLDTLSLSSAGVGTRRRLTLDLGPRWAGRLYWVLGTNAGTDPGLRVQGYGLPLNYEGPGSLFRALVRGANQTPFCNTFGSLDASGRAVAELKALTPIPPTHPWFQADHHYACLIFDPLALPALRILDASEAVRLAILP